MPRKRYFPVYCAVLLCLAHGAAAASRRGKTPPVEGYLNPPYSAVTNGILPRVTARQGKLPEFRPGDTIAYFCGSTNELRLVVCAKPCVTPVSQPLEETVLARTSSVGVVPLRKMGIVLDSALAAGGIWTMKADMTLGSAKYDGTLAQKQEVKVLYSQKDGGAMAVTGDAAVMGGVQGTGNLASVSSGTDMDSESQAAGIGVGRSADSVLSDAATAGSLRQMIERGMFVLLDEQGTIGLLEENGLLDGVYGADNKLLLKDRFVVTAAEEAAMLALLSEKGLISAIVNRECNRALRAGRPQVGKPVCSAVMTKTAMGEKFHHGQYVLYTIEVKNAGNTPIYDLVVFDAVPDRTAFERFPVKGGGAAGFINHYIESEKTMCWRLYMPLEPGETFKMNFILRLDTWSPAPPARTKGK